MTDTPEPEKRRGLALHWQILIGLGVGAAAGLIARATCKSDAARQGLQWFTETIAAPVGQAFIRLIFMVVIPLVVSALILGVAGMGDVRKLGKVGLRTLVFTVLLSATSVLIGLAAANLVRPGARLSPEGREKLLKETKGKVPGAVKQAEEAKSFKDVLIDLIPRNPLQDMVFAFDPTYRGGAMLAVMFFALMVGIAVTVSPLRTGGLVSVLEGLYDVSMVIIGWAMRLAPIGVAALIFSLTSSLGLDILKPLALYVLTVVAALAVHTFVVYSLLVRSLGNRSPRSFFTAVSEAMLTAFGTSSSSATLPTSLRVAEEKLGLKPSVSRFVLTVGATANQNGTALYEGITVLFLAQVFGVDLTFGQQIVVLLMSVMAGIGTAGVPGGSLPLVVMVLVTVKVPAEGIAIILGVDRILDMCRTVVNVTGDLVVAACVDRGGPGEKG